MKGECGMLLLNIDYVPGTEFEVLGLVDGSVVMCKDAGSDFAASVLAFAGGEIELYTAMLSEARQTALDRMVSRAQELHADAVINIRYSTSAVMANAAEMIAYGTAVKFK